MHDTIILEIYEVLTNSGRIIRFRCYTKEEAGKAAEAEKH